jgi:hypothetical protein
MKNYIPPQIYLYNFKYLFVRISIFTAIVLVTYIAISGAPL